MRNEYLELRGTRDANVEGEAENYRHDNHDQESTAKSCKPMR